MYISLITFIFNKYHLINIFFQIFYRLISSLKYNAFQILIYLISHRIIRETKKEGKFKRKKYTNFLSEQILISEYKIYFSLILHEH